MVKVLDGEEIDDILNDKNFMSGLNVKLKNLEDILEKDSKKLGNLFSDTVD